MKKRKNGYYWIMFRCGWMNNGWQRTIGKYSRYSKKCPWEIMSCDCPIKDEDVKIIEKIEYPELDTK